MKELEHRVKNSLSIVSSLIGITINEISDQKALNLLTDIDSRIKSISSIYEHLYLSESIESIDFGTYVKGLAESILTTYKNPESEITLEANIQHFEIDTSRAISLGLIVNELITNSIKHAFRGMPSGKIIIKLIKSDTKIILTVSDNGIGLLSSDIITKSDSIGMMLIKELTKQINGVMKIETENGTSVSITLNSDV
jgi:two-component sensor histidine kinase